MLPPFSSIKTRLKTSTQILQTDRTSHFPESPHPVFPTAAAVITREEILSYMRCVMPPDIIIWKSYPFCDKGITWTYVQGAHRRCHPMGDGTNPVSASSGPGNGQ